MRRPFVFIRRPRKWAHHTGQRVAARTVRIVRRSSGRPLAAALYSASLGVVVGLALLLGAPGLRPSSARATPTIGGGDCWKAGTPLMCRTTWAGARQLMKLRVIDQLPTSNLGRTLWSDMQTAYSNWNVPQGAQSFRDYARTNDSYIYVKLDLGLGCNTSTGKSSGYVMNFDTSSQYMGQNPGNIWWSELYIGFGAADVACRASSVPIAAHELGHTIGLEHSTTSASLMYGGSLLTGPNVTLDIASDSTCTGEKGVSCVFQTN